MEVVVRVAVVAVDTSPADVVVVENEVVAVAKVGLVVVAVTDPVVAKVVTIDPVVVKVDSAVVEVTGRRVVLTEDAMIVRLVAKVVSIEAVVIVRHVAKAVDLAEPVAAIVRLAVRAAAVIQNEVQDESQLADQTARIREFIRPASQVRPRRLNEPRPSVALEQRRHRRLKSTSKFERKRSSQAFRSFYSPPWETVNSVFPVAVFC